MLCPRMLPHLEKNPLAEAGAQTTQIKKFKISSWYLTQNPTRRLTAFKAHAFEPTAYIGTKKSHVKYFEPQLN